MKCIILVQSLLLQLLLLQHAITSSHAQPITTAANTAPMPSDGANVDRSAQHVAAAASAAIDVDVDVGADVDADADATVESQANDGAHTLTQFKITSLLPMPEHIAESVKLEHEALQSKVLSAYDGSQQKVADLTDPLPILDTIAEHEKYGNHGDMFDGISRSIVNGYEAFSNFLNTIIQRPKEVARSISKGITAQLDIIGGKLVGL